MKTEMRYLLVVINLIFIVACNKNDDEIIKSKFEYIQDGEKKVKSVFTKLYDDNSLLISTGKMNIYLEELKKDSFIFNRNSFSQAEFFPETVDRQYSANIFEEPSGHLVITEIDETNQQISGNFEFRTTYIYDWNKSVEINNGEFENIQLEKTNELFSDGRIVSTINGNRVKYTNIDVTDSLSYIRMFIVHPNKNEINLQIPKDVEIGLNKITEENIGNREEIVLMFRKETNGFVFNKPDSESYLILDEIDFENRKLKGNLLGSFGNGLGESIKLERFILDLDWN